MIFYEERTNTDIGFIRNENSKISCTISNTPENLHFLLAQNTFRTCPVYGHQMVAYRDGMLNLFRDDKMQSCVRQGTFPEYFISRNLSVENPKN